MRTLKNITSSNDREEGAGERYIYEIHRPLSTDVRKKDLIRLTRFLVKYDLSRILVEVNKIFS